MANVTQEQIEAWKGQHEEVFQLDVTIKEGDVATAYLKPADRNVMAIALQRVAKDQMVEPGEIILKNCWLGGDERLQLTGAQAESRAQVAAAIAAVALVKNMEVTIKNA
jgi:hypothetical protein